MDETKPGCGVGADGLIVTAAALMGIGIVAVASASASLDRPLIGPDFLSTTLGRQIVFATIGLCVALLTRWLAVGAFRSPWMRLWGPRILFAVTLLGLAAALIPGIAVSQGGSQRWLRLSLGGLTTGAQPSELAKVAMVLMLGSLLAERGANPRSLRRCFVPASLVIGVTVVLVGREDFGTAVLLGSVGAGMLFVAGCRLRHLAAVGVVGGIALTVLLFAERYRIDRITAFLSGQDDPSGMDYQPLQSLATLASGGWSGMGLGLGVQKYGYLPASRTDFVYSVICEEMGVLGGALVIALFGVFVWLGLRTMWASRTRYERLVVFGLTATVGVQAAMNLAVATVVAPTTGISLPLISAGGSGVLTFSLAVGLLAAVARSNRVGTAGARRAKSPSHESAQRRAETAGAW